MIKVGEKAPGFTLTDQYGRQNALSDILGKQHVLLLFYPLDFTPT